MQNNNEINDRIRSRTFYDKRSHNFVRTFDLFSFLPVPKTDLVSSKISVIGTFIMFFLFFVYMVLNFTSFVINNAPRVNEYQTSIGNQTIELPDIAFNFFYGEPFTKTVNNASIFKFQMFQVQKYQDFSKPDSLVPINLTQCTPEWLPNLGFPMLCPQNLTSMSGALYQTQLFNFPRIYVDICSASILNNISCETDSSIIEITQGGRIILFVRNQAPNFDLTTGEKQEAIPYKVFQFFLIPGLYLRSQIDFELSHFSIFPDYFKRWSVEEEKYLSIKGQKDWTTNVSLYNNKRSFQLYFTLDQVYYLFYNRDKRNIFLVYATLLDQVSKWGAFWGVLFAVFAAFFLKYNSRKFYEENDKWQNFETSIGVHNQTREQTQQQQESDCRMDISQIEMTQNNYKK